MNLKINFFTVDFQFNFKNKKQIKSICEYILSNENPKKGSINFIFCSDNYLLEINKKYLNHNTFTDIITFENYDEQNNLMSDIFISIERVKENSKKFNIKFNDELSRILIHGVLHIAGYKDKTKKEKILMTKKEDEYLLNVISQDQK